MCQQECVCVRVCVRVASSSEVSKDANTDNQNEGGCSWCGSVAVRCRSVLTLILELTVGWRIHAAAASFFGSLCCRSTDGRPSLPVRNGDGGVAHSLRARNFLKVRLSALRIKKTGWTV